jgi:hypothetical protein
MNSDIEKRGTFCIVIEKQIAVSHCPLPKGTCMWKHRITGQCTYDENVEITDANSYASRVGLPQIPNLIVSIIQRSVVAALKEELAD